MSTRLFHAIVGFGIALGTASAACLGAVEDQDQAGADDVATLPDGAVPPAFASDASPGDAAVDVPSHDHDASAVHDATVDAFCDVTWPTTKGNPSGPTCGPTEACAEAGAAPWCLAVVTGTTCDATRTVPARCVAGSWDCGPDAIPGDRCTCWANDAASCR
jgi:hypothetical protein